MRASRRFHLRSPGVSTRGATSGRPHWMHRRSSGSPGKLMRPTTCPPQRALKLGAIPRGEMAHHEIDEVTSAGSNDPAAGAP